MGDARYPLVGFASKPWDFDSACIAVMETNGKPEDAVKACRQLGAPIVWVWQNGTVEWWTQHSTSPNAIWTLSRSANLPLGATAQGRPHPESVYRAKVLGRLPGAKQLGFVDVGLMPLLRAEAGKELGELVENMTRATLKGLGQGNPSQETLRNVFTSSSDCLRERSSKTRMSAISASSTFRTPLRF